MFPWLIFGLVSSWLAYAALRLSVRYRPTAGTLIGFLVGTLLPPLALTLAMTWFCCWAFSDPRQKYIDVKWPIWWGRFRYKQHRALRFVWHLGRPPKEESIFSGWRDPPKQYLS